MHAYCIVYYCNCALCVSLLHKKSKRLLCTSECKNCFCGNSNGGEVIKLHNRLLLKQVSN